jgi:serine/threonine-protein kinase HipA
LALVGELPASPVVWDVGCGPGAQTRVLARELATPIRALDILPHLVEELKAHAAAEGLEHLVDARVGDMGEPFAPEGSVDLIWAEGCVYIVGFEWALEHWGRLLRPGGVIAVTEPVWLIDDPPAEARETSMATCAEPRPPAAKTSATSPCRRAPGSRATTCRWKSGCRA